jgi:hypothetical protein
MKMPPLPAIAALAVLVLGIGLWFTVGRHLIDSGMGAGATAATAADSPAIADPEPAQATASAADASLAEESSPNDKPEQAAQTPPLAQTDAADANPAVQKEKANSISISANTYPVGARQNFVEVRVHRTPGSADGSSFVWWTEPATAFPGVDFTPQARITQLLPKGTHAASLFIRLNPQASRKRSAKFYVVIGEPGNGASLGRVTRATVLLPPK